MELEEAFFCLIIGSRNVWYQLRLNGKEEGACPGGAFPHSHPRTKGHCWGLPSVPQESKMSPIPVEVGDALQPLAT